MSEFSSNLISAIRSNKQTHFDSVLADIRQWKHNHGAPMDMVEKDFAQDIVDLFDYTIKSSYPNLLNTGVELLAHWIVNCATEEASNKLFDVANNPWMVRALLTAVDDPRMLEKCNLEEVLYNQTKAPQNKINTDDLMLFVKLPAPKCIRHVFSDPFVLRALNQKYHRDTTKRWTETEHIFWALTDHSVKNALPTVLDSLLSHTETRWIEYCMKAVCQRGSFEAFDAVTQHPKFTDVHLNEIEVFFEKPVNFQVNTVEFILKMQPKCLSLQARSCHISSLIFPTHLSSHLDRRRKEIVCLVDGVQKSERIEIFCQSLKKCHTHIMKYRCDQTEKNEIFFHSFSSLAEMIGSEDLDGLLYHLPAEILDLVRTHPLMQKRILCGEVEVLSENSLEHKRKI